jgi:lipopolysaccharide export system protein LptC
MWAIIVLIVIVLAAVWWFMTQNHKAEPAKQGLLFPAIEYTIQKTPGSKS